MTFDWLSRYGPSFVAGLQTTLWLTAISWVLGFALAVLVALGRVSRNGLISGGLFAFTSVIRGTPLLVQIFILYYGLGDLFAQMPAIRHSFAWPYLRDGFWYVVLALVISTGAYVGEIMRGALLAVPRGEIEAGRAFGFAGLSLVRRIWLPRALQAILPTLAGETVILLKSTALASTVAVMDLLGAARFTTAQTFRVYEPLLLVAAGYVLATLVIEQAFRWIERRAARSMRRAAA